MRASGIRYGVVSDLELVAIDDQALLPGADDVVRLAAVGDTVVVISGAANIPCEPAALQDRQLLANPALFADSAVVFVRSVHAKRRKLVFRVALFETMIHWAEPLHLGLIDHALDSLGRVGMGFPAGNVDAAAALLRDDVLFTDSHGRRCCQITAGTTAGLTMRDGFRLLGRTVALDIAVAEGKWLVQRAIREVRPGRLTAPVALLSGDIDFVDKSMAAETRSQVAEQLAKLRADPESYLNTWTLFQQKERELLARRLEEFRWVPYHGFERDPEDDRLITLTLEAWTVDDRQRFLDFRDSDFELAETIPDEVKFPEQLSGTAARTARLADRAEPVVATYQGAGQRGPTLRLDADADSNPPKTGFVYLSWRGDSTRLRRRDEMLSRIAAGAVPMQNLSALLNDGPSLSTVHKPVVLTEGQLVRAFGGKVPNPRQREAFLAALNTPDLAVIQGPPGTGKTKVIEALIRYLGESVVDTSSVGGRLLVTSYQHDAVNKAAGASTVHGLPAFKVGTRNAGEGAHNPLEQWRRDRLAFLAKRLEQMGPAKSTVRDAALVASPLAYQDLGVEQFQGIVAKFLSIAEHALGLPLVHEIRERARQLAAVAVVVAGPADRTKWRRAAWCIHSSPPAFLDGGPQMARHALGVLAGSPFLGKADSELLEKAADWNRPSQPPFLTQLAALRDRILDQLRPSTPDHFALVKPDQELNRLIDEGLAAWRQQELARPSTQREVLARLAQDLADEAEAERIVLHYTSVFAATCQQAVGSDMKFRHAESTGDPLGMIRFDTVVVDEAARANPLDLQIPMGLAARRIVLVGDHRQLPHLLEPDVERELNESLSDLQRRALKESLFERMFQQLGARDRKDKSVWGSRAVTLDTQYRMHRRLAELVSDCFYRDDGIRLQSPRPDSDFQHSIKEFLYNGQSVCAAWLNVPYSRATAERRKGTSWTRPAEAQQIAKSIQQLHKGGHGHSIGVISFYRSQVNEIWNALADLRLAVRRSGGDGAVPIDGLDLHVGTVDAFQGMEFEVVYLSLTRSNDRPATTARERQGKYGHLCIANRLCVAMSRAQRLLVVAGDAAMARAKGAEEDVLGIVEFHKMCSDPGQGEARHGILL